VRKVHCNCCEGAGAPLCTFLRLLRGVHKYYLTDYVATYARECQTSDLGGGSIAAIDLAGHEHTILATNDNVVFWREKHSPISPDGELVAFIVEWSNVSIDQRGRVLVYDFQGRQRAIFTGWGMMGWRAAQ